MKARIATAILFLTFVPRVPAATVSFDKVADTNTAIPHAIGNFTGFRNNIPVIDNGIIAFEGLGTDGQSGIYTFKNGALAYLADTQTPAPNRPGPFIFLGHPSIDKGVVAFEGWTSMLGGPFEALYKASDPSFYDIVVERGTPVPPDNVTPVIFVRAPSIDGDRVSFFGAKAPINSNNSYIKSGGVISVLADDSTPAPGGGNFNGTVGTAQLSDGEAVFHGDTVAHSGIYRTRNNAIEKVVDDSTPIPGGSDGNFSDFSTFPVMDDDTIAFMGYNINRRGIFAAQQGGALEVIADSTMTIPGHPALFYNFDQYVSIDKGSIVFEGFDFNANPFAGIYLRRNGQLQAIVEKGDLLDGKVISDFQISNEAISGNDIAFWVQFTDESEGIFVAHLGATPIPLPPAVWSGAIVLAGAIVRIRRRQG